MLTPTVTCLWLLIKSAPKYFSIPQRFCFLCESVLIERRPFAGLRGCVTWPGPPPFSLFLPLTSFCSFLQESDGAAVVSALRFHTALNLPFSIRAFDKPEYALHEHNLTLCVRVRVCACLSVHGHVYTWPPVSHIMHSVTAPSHFPFFLFFFATVLQSVETFQTYVRL